MDTLMKWPDPIAHGDPAPRFTLPSVDRDGTHALDHYLGRSALMVGFFRGLYCPFCRRQMAQFGACSEKLRGAGVETLGVLITTVSRGLLYFRYHPPRLAMAADETAVTHRAYGVPRFELIPDNGNPNAGVWPRTVTETQAGSVRVNPGGIFPEPVLAHEAAPLLNQADGFPWTDEDARTMEQHWTQLDGLFLIDRGGTVRWRYLEAYDDPTEMGGFPSVEELMAAARDLAG